jgi:hypothetical protein
LKLRSVRSTWWTLLVFAAGMLGLAILVMSLEHNQPSFDPTNASFAGLAIGQVAIGVLGVLAVTSDFSSGMIHATFAAAPRRPLVLAAKATILTAVTLTDLNRSPSYQPGRQRSAHRPIARTQPR